jgi:hypothetical protein
MTHNKQLTEIVGEIGNLILDIAEHPDYKALEDKGYQPDVTVGDAYQAIADLNYELTQQEKERGGQ